MLQVRWSLKPSCSKDKKTLAAQFNPMTERFKAHRDFDLHAHELEQPPTKKFASARTVGGFGRAPMAAPSAVMMPLVPSPGKASRLLIKQAELIQAAMRDLICPDVTEACVRKEAADAASDSATDPGSSSGSSSVCDPSEREPSEHEYDIDALALESPVSSPRERMRPFAMRPDGATKALMLEESPSTVFNERSLQDLAEEAFEIFDFDEVGREAAFELTDVSDSGSFRSSP